MSGAKKLINFSGVDTMFFYKLNGVLRQALKVWITNRTGSVQSGSFTVYTDNNEPVITKLSTIDEGKKTYTVFAPQVYPNIGSPFFSYHGSRHHSINAKAELKIGSQKITNTVTIGRWRPWTIYVCQDTCADFTWGHSEEETISLSTNLTETHLKAIEKTANESFESQNRWNINQTMEIEFFLEKKRNLVKELFERVKDDHVSIGPIFNSCLTATMSTEQAIRSLYYARELEKEYGIDFSVVEHIEVPSITWGMATIFAEAGIKYFVKGWLLFMVPFMNYRDDVPIFYWEGPDGSKVLTAMDKGSSLKGSYSQANFLYKEYEEAVKELHGWWIPHFENHSEYPYDAFMLLGSHGDLGRESAGQVSKIVSNIIRYNSESWEYPKIVNAKWKQFFKHIEDFVSKHGTYIPTLRGDFGTSWEEWPANLAGIFSGLRHGVNLFIIAEKLVALASLFEPEVYTNSRDRLKLAEKRMGQIAEHTWSGSPRYPVEQKEAFHRRLKWQKELNEIADRAIDKSLDVISKQIQTKKENIILVFNPLSWQRTDIAKVEVDDLGPFILKDNDNGELLPNGVIDIGKQHFLLFVSKNVPPLGYKCYTISSAGQILSGKSTILVGDDTIENGFYRVKVDKKTGGISSILDKRLCIDLVDSKSSYKLNQYVYLSEGKEFTPTRAMLSYEKHEPISASLNIRSQTLRSKIRTTITLYAEIDRIDISNELIKTPSSESQEVHFIFPFNVPDREYHYEATGTIIAPGLTQYGGDQLRGSGQTSYASQSFVDVSNEKYGVTLSQVDSYLIQFGHRTTFEISTYPDPSNSTVLSLIMLNKYKSEMVPDQGGISNFLFRYSIRGHKGKFKGSNSVHFGWETNNGLLTKTLKPNQNGKLPNKSYSFLSIGYQNVVATTLKTSEEGVKNGLIVRLWETDNKSTKAPIKISNIGFTSAIKTDLLERNQYELKVSNNTVFVPIKARGISTIRLLPK